MKKFTLVAFFLATLIGHTLAQAPQSFNYQAVARTSGGDLISNQSVSFRLSLLQGSATGTSVYVETHAINTNVYGLANLKVGEGSTVSGSFGSIDWTAGPYYLKVEMDENGGTAYQLMGTSQLLSVPYALHSGSAETPDGDWTVSGNDMYSAPSGNVGIGTSSPGAKLDVAGRIGVGSTGGSIFIGQDAGLNDDLTDNNNVFIGNESGKANTSGYSNAAVGFNALISNTIGRNNAAIGDGSLEDNTIGNYNVAVGRSSSGRNISGDGNTAIGSGALFYNEMGDHNTVIGSGAGSGATNQSGCVFIGYDAGSEEYSSNRLHVSNSYDPLIYGEFDNELLAVNGKLGVGTLSPSAQLDVAGHIAVTGTGGSVFLGQNAGQNDDLTDNSNVFIGSSSGSTNSTGSSNIGIGRGSLLVNSTASSNIAIGGYAMRYHEEGNANVYIGVGAGENDIFGWENTVIGYEAGYNNVSGNGNVFLGFQAGFNESGNDKLYIQNSNSATPLIYGDFSSDILAVNGKLGIGTHSPSVPAHVTGGTDASLTSGGYLLTGSTTGENIVIDENEIMARLNGAANTLHLQRDGGSLTVHYGLTGTSQFRVGVDGKTGVGTTGANAKLHVNTAAAEDGFRVQIEGGTKFKVEASGSTVAGSNMTGAAFAFQMPNTSIDIEGRGLAYSWNTYSDNRLKSNQRTIEYGLDEVMQLRPKSYEHHSSSYSEEGDFVMVTDHSISTVGFIAQEVQKIIPEAVSEPEDQAGQLWSMDYDRLIPVLTRAIQEQQEMIEALESKVEALNRKLSMQPQEME